MSFFYRFTFFMGIVIASLTTHSQSESSGSQYSFEVAPTLGINLPSNIPGASKTIYVIGAQGDIPIDPSVSVVTGLYWQKRGSDSSYNTEGGLRINVDANLGEIFIDGGAHLAKVSFNGSRDRDTDGSCYLNCRSTSGTKIGFFGGGGLVTPLGSIPLRLGGRFYVEPGTWLLLYAAIALRF